VMREGRISGELPRSAASEHAVLDLALPKREPALAA
jgi:L-arabinose transport system ATP-binding protein